MKQKEFKEKMPTVAAWVDDLVAVFGAEAIHGQIRKGLKGEPVFFASENGYEIGAPVDVGARWSVSFDSAGMAVAREIKR